MKNWLIWISNVTKNHSSSADANGAVHGRIAASLPLPNLMREGITLLFGESTRKSMVALIDQAVVSATNFLTGVIIGRACSKEEFGLYMLGLTIVFFITDLQTSLISTPYMVYSPRLKGNSHAQYTGSTLIHQLALSSLAIIGLIVGGTLLSFGIGPGGLAPIMWALAAVIAFVMLRENVRRIIFAGLRMQDALLLDSLVAFIQITSVSLLAYFGLLSASRTYWIAGFAAGIAVLSWLIPNRQTFIMNIHLAITDFAHNWSLGKWVFASGLLWTLSMNFYPWILAAFHGTAAVGVWAACLGIVALVNPLLLGVQNFLGPQIANVYAQDGIISLRSFVLKSSVVFGLVIFSPFFILLFFGDSLMTLIYSDMYSGNGLVVSIMALSLVAVAVAFSSSRALYVLRRADVDFWINFLPLLSLFTFGLWLVKSFGLLGAAYGLLFAHATASIARCAAFVIVCRRGIYEKS